ncbi:MAG TPA: DUF1844 domain-containing protein [bacterium]|nr:DUF1844 domain-containing protein [bacterium]HPP30774.1 DUF1844 domain-containing protein [bacterium]
MKEGLFTFVISFFADWGWQAMGKVANPLTGKTEKNLELARQIIDIMEMLHEKTKGNLTKDEERILTATIAELQLNYVDEMEKERASKEKKSADGEKENTEKTE